MSSARAAIIEPPVEDADAPRARRGRPLSAERSDHILAHVWELLQEMGYDNVAHLESGVNGWIAEGRPVERE